MTEGTDPEAEAQGIFGGSTSLEDAGTARWLRSPLLVVLLVLLAKVGFFLLFADIELNIAEKNVFFIISADHEDFFKPVDNLIEKGHYTLNGVNPFAGRLPGMIFPYVFYRFFFQSQVSLYLTGFFILFMSLFASYCLVMILKTITGLRTFILAGLICLELIPYYWHWDWALHPNSLAASCLVIGIYFLQKFFSNNNRRQLVFSGFFFTWLFMLRGFTLVFIPITILIITLHLIQRQENFSAVAVSLLCFVAPLCLIESLWVARNYVTFKKFIPLQTAFVPGMGDQNPDYGYGSVGKYSMEKLRDLINCWGGDNFYYFKGGDMNWFMMGDKKDAAEHFNAKLFSGNLNAPNLEQLREDLKYSFNQILNPAQHDSIEGLLAAKCIQYRADFMAEHKSYFYLVAPFKRLKNLVAKNVTQDWPGPSFNDSGLVRRGLKLFSLSSYFIMLLAYIPLLFLTFRSVLEKPIYLMLALFSLSLLFLFAFVINCAHYNYFIYGFIPMVMLNLCLIYELVMKAKKKEAVI